METDSRRTLRCSSSMSSNTSDRKSFTFKRSSKSVRKDMPSVTSSSVMIVFLMLFGGVVGMCPEKCECDDTNLIVRCIRAGLEVMPNTLNPRIRTLVYRHNQFPSVDVTLMFLSHLQNVDFGHNAIVSVQDRAFRNQQRLVSLKLDHNKIGRVGQATFYGLREMEVLSLRKNDLEVVEANTFAKATKLQKLDLAKNRITRVDPAAFAKLTDLRILNLEGNALSSIPVEALSGLRSLAELRLSGNPLKVVGADAFSELRSLTRLDLSGCQLRAMDKDAFRGLQTLRHLRLDDNSFMDVPTPSLAHVSNLRELKVGSNPFKTIRDGSFRGLRALRSLGLSACPALKTIESGAFRGCSDLEKVTITQNRKLRHIAGDAFDATPNLKHLSLSDNQLEGLSKSLIHWTELHHLDLSMNPWVCGCGLSFLPDVLEHLNAAKNVTVVAGKCSGPEELRGTSLHDFGNSDRGCESETYVNDVVPVHTESVSGSLQEKEMIVNSKSETEDLIRETNATAVIISVSTVVVVLLLAVVLFAVFRCRQKRRYLSASGAYPAAYHQTLSPHSQIHGHQVSNGQSAGEWLRSTYWRGSAGSGSSGKSRYTDSESFTHHTSTSSGPSPPSSQLHAASSHTMHNAQQLQNAQTMQHNAATSLYHQYLQQQQQAAQSGVPSMTLAGGNHYVQRYETSPALSNGRSAAKGAYPSPHSGASVATQNSVATDDEYFYVSSPLKKVSSPATPKRCDSIDEAGTTQVPVTVL